MTDPGLSQRVTLLSAQPAGTFAETYLTQHLLEPLAKQLSKYFNDWLFERWDEATKSDFLELTGGKDRSPLLLVGCQGLRLPPWHPDLQTSQGALLCQDWPGPEICPSPTEDHFFSGRDLSVEHDCFGQISFLFGGYGAGFSLPEHSPDRARPEEDASGLTAQPRSFINPLAQKLLSNGQLALVGRIDEGWPMSIGSWSPLEGEQIISVAALEDSLKSLLQGSPLGAAIRPLARQYATAEASLAGMLGKEWVVHGEEQPKYTARRINSYSNFIILGDPAATLPKLSKNRASRKPRTQPMTFNPKSSAEYYSCFISYSHTERDRVFAGTLADRLEKIGIDYWLDMRDINPGDELLDEID